MKILPIAQQTREKNIERAKTNFAKVDIFFINNPQYKGMWNNYMHSLTKENAEIRLAELYTNLLQNANENNMREIVSIIPTIYWATYFKFSVDAGKKEQHEEEGVENAF
jgi:hypothetical protein